VAAVVDDITDAAAVVVFYFDLHLVILTTPTDIIGNFHYGIHCT
jgi:hypothetical protein